MRCHGDAGEERTRLLRMCAAQREGFCFHPLAQLQEVLAGVWSLFYIQVDNYVSFASLKKHSHAAAVCPCPHNPQTDLELLEWIGASDGIPCAPITAMFSTCLGDEGRGTVVQAALVDRT